MRINYRRNDYSVFLSRELRNVLEEGLTRTYADGQLERTEERSENVATAMAKLLEELVERRIMVPQCALDIAGCYGELEDPPKKARKTDSTYD